MSESESSRSGDRGVCPKCGRKHDSDAPACPRCGLRFALWNPSLADPRTQLTPAGLELWRQVEANWQDVNRHEEFAKYCLQSNLLPALGVVTAIAWTASRAMPSPARCRPRFWPRRLWVCWCRSGNPPRRSPLKVVLVHYSDRMALAIAAALVWGPGGIRARTARPTVNVEIPQ